MSLRQMVIIGLILGSLIGGYVPVLWGDSALSSVSILFSFIGGLCGAWLAYRFYQSLQ